MKKLIQIAAIEQNPHRDLKRYPPDPEQVDKIIASINRTCFWNNLVVRPHPDIEGRYQLAYGHTRIEACRKLGITEIEPEVIDLGDYDMFCCMVDENLTQQRVVPKTVFEIVSAAIKEAEKMLRETNNVYDFNAYFKRSRGLETLLQKSNCLMSDNAFLLEREHYERAKAAIEPSGEGLGRGFLQHFLPPHTVANNNTLQTAINAYYQEEWRKEGDRLTEESRLMLWKGADANDKAMRDAALELEKQAKARLPLNLNPVTRSLGNSRIVTISGVTSRCLDNPA